jgi:hypothetical protein
MNAYETWYEVVSATGEVFSDSDFGVIEFLGHQVPIRKITKTEICKMNGFTYVKTSVHKTFEEMLNASNGVN